jgi:hypothetical protein
MNQWNTTELRSMLEDVLSRYFGAERRIARLEHRPSAYRSSFNLQELEVSLEDGASLRLMLKDLSRLALMETARRVKPAFLYDPLREIETYRTILEPNHLNSATCYGAVVNSALGRYWLFLEKVPGVALYQVGDFAIWQQAARWLADLHSHYAGKDVLECHARAAHLLIYDQDYYWLWMRRALEFLGPGRRSTSKSDPGRLEWLAERYTRVVERLLSLPLTLIHGEFYASNVLVHETADRTRICPVDWEMAAVGPGLIDLAALTAGAWTDEEKTALALAYRDVLQANGGWHPPPEALFTTLDCCQLHLAVRWLGWSFEWSPPPQHAQNWLNEALRLAEKLTL